MKYEKWNLPAQYVPRRTDPVRQSRVYHLRRVGENETMCDKVSLSPPHGEGWRRGRGMYVMKNLRKFPKSMCKFCAKIQHSETQSPKLFL